MRLQVYDASLVYKGEIDDFQSCIINRRYRGTETLSLSIPITSRNVPLLQKHYWLYAGPKRIFEILHREVTDRQDMLKIIAYGGGLAWAKRVTIPPDGYAYHTASGSRDAIVKAYITANAITPVTAARTVPFLTCATVQAGESITDRTRLKPLVDEVIRVLASADMGYCFDFDTETPAIVFDTYTGADRTATNTGDLPPVIFDLEFDNILSRHYIDSLTNAQNVTYVGGQGEGDDRTIIIVGTAAGAERFEEFKDARDTDDETELINRAIADQNSGTLSYETKINPYANMTYEVDFYLGDLVTAQDRELGLTLDTRITEVREIYQQGKPDGLECVFGNTIPSFLNTLKSQQKQINQLATR